MRSTVSLEGLIAGSAGFIKSLLSFSGRAARADYWLAWLIIAACFAVNQLGAHGVQAAKAAWPGHAFTTLAWAMLVFTFYISFAVTVRRLHDRGKSGWWALLYWVTPPMMDASGDPIGGTIGLIIWTVCLVINVAAFIELSCFAGTAGRNVYGAEPAGALAVRPAVT